MAEIGQTISHYRILEKLGEGGMGVVYRAFDENLQREVAVKVLPSGALSDESLRKRFRVDPHKTGERPRFYRSIVPRTGAPA